VDITWTELPQDRVWVIGVESSSSGSYWYKKVKLSHRSPERDFRQKRKKSESGEQKDATIAGADIFGKGQNIMVVESAIATGRQTHFSFLPMTDQLPTPAASKLCVPFQMNSFSVLCSGHVIHFTRHVSLSLKNMACRTLVPTTMLKWLSSGSIVMIGFMW
jgi:hypothetical protein